MGGDEESAVPERPVTDGRASVGALLARFEEPPGRPSGVLADQQAQLGAILEQAAEVVRTVADPEAAAYEVEQLYLRSRARPDNPARASWRIAA